MNKTCVFAAILCVFIDMIAASAVAEPVSFTRLGDLAGGAFESRATAVSANGTTVVGYSSSSTYQPGGAHEAFHWKNGIIQGIRGLDPQPGNFSRAFGVNGDGSVMVGILQDSLPGHFVWTNGNLANGADSEIFPLNMSANGVYVGYTTTPPAHRAYKSAGGGIPIIPGGNSLSTIWNHASAVSDDGGAVVGWSIYSVPMTVQAYRWTSATLTVGLGFLPGHTVSRAMAISGNGLLVGGHSGPSQTPFLWTQSSGMVPFTGGFAPAAMSFDGSVIVGGSSVWDAVHGTRSLSSILTGAGVNMAGWNIFEVTDVSADGLVVSGSATNPQGNSEAFRAVIPEPATAGLMLVGSAFLLRRRRA